MAKPIDGPKAMAEGWALVGWLSLAVGVLVLLILASRGAGTEGVRAVVRTTPKLSVILFLSAFLAAPLLSLWPAPFTHWLRRNRRYLGVSFAVAHFTHLGALTALVSTSRTAREDLDALTVIGGGPAYLFIAAMTATSFDHTAAWLGARDGATSTPLVSITSGSFWIIFFYSYIPRAFHHPCTYRSLSYFWEHGDANLRPASEASLGVPGSLAPTMTQGKGKAQCVP